MTKKSQYKRAALINCYHRQKNQVNILRPISPQYMEACLSHNKEGLPLSDGHIYNDGQQLTHVANLYHRCYDKSVGKDIGAN